MRSALARGVHRERKSKCVLVGLDLPALELLAIYIAVHCILGTGTSRPREPINPLLFQWRYFGKRR